MDLKEDTRVVQKIILELNKMTRETPKRRTILRLAGALSGLQMTGVAAGESSFGDSSTVGVSSKRPDLDEKHNLPHNFAVINNSEEAKTIYMSLLNPSSNKPIYERKLELTSPVENRSGSSIALTINKTITESGNYRLRGEMGDQSEELVLPLHTGGFPQYIAISIMADRNGELSVSWCQA